MSKTADVAADRGALRVLVVEDSEDDVALMVAALRRGGYAPVVRRVETAAALREGLAAAEWDIVVSDCSMPNLDVLRALALVRESGREVPFLLLSGTIQEGSVIAALEAGADDFIPKTMLRRLIPVVERLIAKGSTRADELDVAARGGERPPTPAGRIHMSSFVDIRANLHAAVWVDGERIGCARSAFVLDRAAENKIAVVGADSACCQVVDDWPSGKRGLFWVCVLRPDGLRWLRAQEASPSIRQSANFWIVAARVDVTD